MREKMLAIAARLRSEAPLDCDVLTPNEVITFIATVIEDEMRSRVETMTCSYCGAQTILVNGRYVPVEPHKPGHGCI